MATSGSIDFSLNRNEIIKEAMDLIGVLSIGENPTDAEVATCSRSLNMMLKTWTTSGIHLWTQETGTLWLVEGQAKYLLGSGATSANWTTSYTETTLSADEAAAQTTLSVTTSAGMTAADIIGIVLDDDSIQWTTIDSVPNSTSVVVDDALTGVAAEDNVVYWYTTRAERPIKIVNIYRRDTSGNDIPLSPPIARDTYEALPDKDLQGTPNSYYYDPQITQGGLYVWPTADDDKNHILFVVFQRTIEDMDASTDDFDLPQEWAETISYNLAVRIAPKFDAPLRADTKETAKELKEELETWDSEPVSIFFQPDLRR